MAGIADITSATRDVMGRYFSLVSAVPAVVLTIYAFLLIASGAWSHYPRFGRAFDRLADLKWGEAVALGLLSLGIALLMHPLQYAMVQVLEGYWGSGPVAGWLRSACIARNRGRLARLRRRHIEATGALHAVAPDFAENHPFRYSALLTKRDEAARLLSEMPSPDEIMPTRLGNVLRFYERAAGAAYGLDAIRVMPYLSRVASSDDIAYLNDQRSNLDLAVRMCLTSLLASALWLVIFWRHVWWLPLAAIPVGVAYLSYRGAVVAAGEYGRALAVVIALNRFALYKRLHLKAPATAAAERRVNRTVHAMLDYSDSESVRYFHDNDGAGDFGSKSDKSGQSGTAP